MTPARTALAAAAFALLALAVALGLTRAADAAVLAVIQSIRLPALDVGATILSLAGLGPVIALLLAVIALATVRRDGPRAFVPLAILLAGTALEALLKTVLDHPGPPHELSRTLPLPDWLRLASPEFGNAFPSGHAFRATFLLGLAAGGRRAVVVAAAVFAVAMWLSRLYAGEHWPSDVLGGIALGISAAALVRATVRTRERGTATGEAGT